MATPAVSSPFRTTDPNRHAGDRRSVDTTVADSGTSAARILVVEDQDDVRRMLVTALQIDGHHVEEANCARDGLRCLQAAHYDLVLSDYSMPGQTGGWMLNEAS